MRVVSLLLSFAVLAGCSPTTAPTQVTAAAVTQQATQTTPPTTSVPSASPDLAETKAGESDLCEWFVKTQFLRSERISAEVDLGKVFREENPDPAEFLQVLKNYRPHQDTFLQEWARLGPHREAQEFWEKELSAVQIRAMSFDAMIEGLENADQEKFEEGIALFEEASLVGNEAETAMLSIRSKCIGQ